MRAQRHAAVVLRLWRGFDEADLVAREGVEAVEGREVRRRGWGEEEVGGEVCEEEGQDGVGGVDEGC